MFAVTEQDRLFLKDKMKAYLDWYDSSLHHIPKASHWGVYILWKCHK